MRPCPGQLAGNSGCLLRYIRRTTWVERDGAKPLSAVLLRMQRTRFLRAGRAITASSLPPQTKPSSWMTKKRVAANGRCGSTEGRTAGPSASLGMTDRREWLKGRGPLPRDRAGIKGQNGQSACGAERPFPSTKSTASQDGGWCEHEAPVTERRVRGFTRTGASASRSHCGTKGVPGAAGSRAWPASCPAPSVPIRGLRRCVLQRPEDLRSSSRSQRMSR